MSSSTKIGPNLVSWGSPGVVMLQAVLCYLFFSLFLPFGQHLGANLGAKLDPSWAKLGANWTKLGPGCAMLHHLGALLERLAAILKQCLTIFETF